MRCDRHLRSFTMVELLVVAATLLLLFFLLLPSIMRAKRARDQRCRNNLHQIALAAKTSDGAWPAEILVAGVKEAAESGKVFAAFLVISNELLGNPKVLVCPQDKERRPTKEFGQDFGDTNLSYFVGLDSSDWEPKVFLSGDRNLEVAVKQLAHGVFPLTEDVPLGWTKDIHSSCGNILLGEGSVHFFFPTQLVDAVRRQGGNPTNRLAIP